ncbi:putative membrane protein [Synechococcus sp. WH 8103]|nr:putative membrane protein [Synechococcus sp. RS9915]CRY91166.1 putative membrane protein [Synechococcus sp. WH 8103]
MLSMNTSQMLIAFLAFGASASSIVAWRFAASRLWSDDQ